MRLRPLTRYPLADYPRAGSAAERADLAQALPQRWRGQPTVVAVLAVCVTLSVGYGTGMTVQDVRDAADRAAIALHLKQPPPVRLMGMVMVPRVPIPNSTPSTSPSNAASPTRGHKP